MNRRDIFRNGAALAAASWWPVGLQAATGPQPNTSGHSTLAAAWHQTVTGNQNVGEYVGLLTLDWQAAQVRVQSRTAVPTRAHGLVVLSDGGFVAVAVRPGNWIVRCDPQGLPVQWLHMENESEDRTLDGHLCPSACGQWLYTAETSPGAGQGWISVRDALTLRKVAQWRSYGVEPHQILLDPHGMLMVANGGLLRGDADKKRDLPLMDSSLVRLDPGNGDRLGQWRLKDQRLGLRHMAWSQPIAGAVAGTSKPLLGIALQNEHDDLNRRRASPVLTLWDGESLQTPAPGGEHVGGYCGDIVGAEDGGFVLSCLRSSTVVRWSPSNPNALAVIAELKDAGALARWPLVENQDRVLLASTSGVARWHPKLPPAILRWPPGMALDNHWALVA